jgi:methionyl-tRNA formyltransferase
VLRYAEKETGVTVHHMTDTFDAGRIVVQAPVEIMPSENLLTLSISLARASVPLILGVIDRYRRGERPIGVPQDHEKATAAPMVRDHHLEVHWNESAKSIEDLTRAAFPVFDVHTTFRGERLIIRSASRSRLAALELEPGEVFYDHATLSLFVGTGDGLLALTTVEYRGQPTSGSRFSERYLIARSPGERLG